MPDPDSRISIRDDGQEQLRLYIADQTRTDGTSWGSCPRRMLTSTLSRLHAETGLNVVASFEHEFTLRGVDAGLPMTLGRLRAAEPFGGDLLALLEENGLQPECWIPEYGDAQYEITLRQAPALVAADRAVLLRELVRDLARRRGLAASFAPLAAPDATGNGLHIHLSLHDDEGRAALFDPHRRGRLSEAAERFCAGVLHHAAAVTAVTAGSPASHLRLQPHHWSAARAVLAERHREAMIRICPTVSFGSSDEAKQFNLEFRAADATSNPWLALGVIIAAGLEGMTGDLPAPTVHPETVGDDELLSAAPLNPDLESGLRALETDPVAAKWFDPDLLATYLAVKRAELAAVAGLDDDAVCARVADVY